MIFNIKHKTIFKYDNPPLSAIQKLRLTPRNDINQKILNWDIDIKGCSIELDTYDYHDNRIHHILLSFWARFILSSIPLLSLLKVALPTPLIFFNSVKLQIGEVSRCRIIEFAVDAPIP